MKKKVIEIRANDSLIIQVLPGIFGEYDHLLRPSDRMPVDKLLGFIADESVESARKHNVIKPGYDAVKIFLGGGVVNNPLFITPGRVYSDVDILAVFPHTSIAQDVARKFIQAHRSGTPIIKYGRGAAEVNLSVIEEKDDGKMYFGMPLDERVSLKVTKPENSRASLIDLCMVEQGVYDAYRTHRFK